MSAARARRGVPHETTPSGVHLRARPEETDRVAQLEAENARLRDLLERREELATLLVHDLKGPLTAITMNLDVALADLAEAARVDATIGETCAALEDCRTAGARLFRMIANLLDVSRAEEVLLSPQRQTLDVAFVVRELARDHAVEAAQRGIALTCEIPPGTVVDADPDLFGRTIENLLDNALRFVRAGGRVLVRATSDADGRVEIVVANDGPPIASELRARLFEKYVRLPSPEERALHRGLGLYFCRLAVEAHGGALDLVDLPGFGTSFCASLPALGARVRSEPSAPTRSCPSSSAPRRA